jgi:ribosomal protein S8E
MELRPSPIVVVHANIAENDHARQFVRANVIAVHTVVRVHESEAEAVTTILQCDIYRHVAIKGSSLMLKNPVKDLNKNLPYYVRM